MLRESKSVRMPAEWEAQDAIWLSWPCRGEHWNKQSLTMMQHKWAEIAAVISQTQEVHINTHAYLEEVIPDLVKEAGGEMNNLSIFIHPNDDVWCRDHGAVFVEEDDKLVATNWRFNGWGGRFAPWDQDDKVAAQMAQSQGLACKSYSEVLEGGAIESNGRGSIMTTEAVLLNPNRNPHLDKSRIEKMFSERLGAQDVIWLQDGIVGDDTGGHIDDIARFVSEDRIVISEDPTGPNCKSLNLNDRLLKEQTTAEVIKIPMPEVCEVPTWRLPVLPASYVNFLITNDSVLIPTYRQKKNDDRALGIIAEQFPGRDVMGVDCLDIVAEGGALHCISMQQPKKKSIVI